MIDLQLKYQSSSYVPMKGDIVYLQDENKFEVVRSVCFSYQYGMYMLSTNEGTRLLDNDDVRIVMTKDIRLTKTGDYVVSLTNKSPTLRTIGSVHKVLKYDRTLRTKLKYVCSGINFAYDSGVIENEFALLALEESQSEPTFPCYMKYVREGDRKPFIVRLINKTVGTVVESSDPDRPIGFHASTWNCFDATIFWELLENYSVPVEKEPTFPCYMKFIGNEDGQFVVWLTSKTEGMVVESSNNDKPVGTRSTTWSCFTYPAFWQLLENYSIPVQDKGEDKLEIVDIWMDLADNACNIIETHQLCPTTKEAGTSLTTEGIDELYMLAADFIKDNEITELPDGMVSALRNYMRSRSKYWEDVEDFLNQLQDLVPKATIDPTIKWFNDNSGNSSLTKREVTQELAIWHELVQAVTKVLIEYRDNDQESLLKPENIHILHEMIDSFIEKHDIREIPYEALNILRFTRVHSDNYNIQDEYNYYVDSLIEKVKTNQTQIQNKEQQMNKLDLRLLLSLMAAMSSTDQEGQKDATNSEYVAIVTKDNNYEGYVYINSVEDANKIMQLPENEGKKLHLFKYESTLAQKPRKVISVERV